MRIAILGIGLTARRLRLAVAAALLLAPAAAPAADGYEPDDTTAQAPLVATDGVYVSHTFEPAGDVDWLMFNATAGDKFLIATAGGSDTYLELYGAGGTDLLEADDDSGPGNSARIVWQCWQTGTYHVRSSHFSPVGTGDYQIGVAKSGKIVGTVLFSGGGTRPSWVDVVVFDSLTGAEVGRGSTHAVNLWSYEVDGLLPGSYVVQFVPFWGTFLGEWWKDATDAYAATPIDVVAGQTTWDISPTLDPGGSISGTIRFAGGLGQPESVYVRLVPVVASNIYAGVSARASTGWNYRFDGLPKGSYRLRYEVYAESSCTYYGDEWWRDGLDEASATPVVVIPGLPVEGVDPTLDVRHGGISGTVGFAPGGVLPVAVDVEVFDAANLDHVTEAYTYDDMGWTYAFCGLPPGAYKVRFTPFDVFYAWEWWEDASSAAAATALLVTPGASAAASPVLDLTAGISGTVLFKLGSELPHEVDVTVRESATGFMRSTWTNADRGWRYAFDQLRAGSYQVEFAPGGGSCRDEWWDNAPTSTEGAILDLAPGEQLTDVSPVLSPLATDPTLFYDTFTHGDAGGDPDWVRRAGQWTVDPLRRYVSRSLATVNLSLVRRFAPQPLHFGAGRIEARAGLTTRAAGVPNARIVFSCLGTTRYRYVELARGSLTIGQVGTLGGEAGGVKVRRPLASIVPGAMLPVRVDLRPDGLVEASIKGTPALKYRFAEAMGGGVGVGAVKAKAIFDNVVVSDSGALP